MMIMICTSMLFNTIIYILEEREGGKKGVILDMLNSL